MRKKSREEGDADADDSSSVLSRLPVDIILQILKKVKDLKSLCCCYLVSKHFSSIVLQVDAISVINPRITPSRPINSFINDDFFLMSVYMFLRKFKGVKSLIIEIPSSSSEIGGIDNSFLFKWMVNFGSRVESFIFLSPNSICDKDGFYLSGNREEEEEAQDMGLNDIVEQKFSISLQCLKEVMMWHVILMDIIKELPKLEEVSVTGSGRRGRLSLSGEKLSQVKEWAHSASQTEFKRVQVPNIPSKCYIPVLRLPVSGYVMKGVFCALVERHDLQGGNDGFEDKEGAAYTEAVREILMKDMMHTYHVA